MGVEQSSLPYSKSKTSSHDKQIQGLYQMYHQSIRLSQLIKPTSNISTQKNSSSNNPPSATTKKHLSQQSITLQQLMQPFQQRNSYQWGIQIPQLFKKYFKNNFNQQWVSSKQFFYELLLQNSGIQPANQQLLQKSHLKLGVSTIEANSSSNKNINTGNNYKKSQKPSYHESQQCKTFEQYFHKVIKQRFKFNFRSSVIPTDQIDRNTEEYNQVMSERMTVEQELNYINYTIIGVEEEEKVNHDESKQELKENKKDKTNQEQDDQYFLPLITKRHKNKKQKFSQFMMDEQHIDKKQEKQQQNVVNITKNVNTKSEPKSKKRHLLPQIQMSKIQYNIKYSKNRIQSCSVILPNTIFHERMNFTSKVQTDQLLRIYRQVSNTIQQTINSCNLISCPLKHFLYYFDHKTSKKNINNQIIDTNSNIGSINNVKTTFDDGKNDRNSQNVNKGINSDMKLARVKSVQQKEFNVINSQMKHYNQSQQPISTPSNSKKSKLSHTKSVSSLSFSSTISSQQTLYQILIQNNQKSQLIRKRRQHNTNMLLKQIKSFTEAYTQFIYHYLNFNKLEETDLDKFVNIDTVYGIILRNIWNIVSWIAERGYQYEEYVIKEIVQIESANFQTFTETEIENDPTLILQRFAHFINKDVRKIKMHPTKLKKAYLSLMKLKNQLIPQKYFKKIIIFYRQATNCCQGADDLINVYEFLLKNAILNNFTAQMHIFRMKNLIQKLLTVESSNIDGAGEIIYAWTTWNIVLEMFLMKIKDFKKQKMLYEDKRILSTLERPSMKKKSSIKEPYTQKKTQKESQKLRQKMINSESKKNGNLEFQNVKQQQNSKITTSKFNQNPQKYKKIQQSQNQMNSNNKLLF